MSIAQEDNIIKMNKASIEFLERISGLKYISISEPAHLIKIRSATSKDNIDSKTHD